MGERIQKLIRIRRGRVMLERRDDQRRKREFRMNDMIQLWILLTRKNQIREL